MKKASIFLLSATLSACAQNHFTPNILEQGFGENVDSDGIVFLEEYRFLSNKSYGFRINETEFKAAYTAKADGVKTNLITISSCPELKQSVKKLKTAILNSSKVALGIIPPKELDVLVMDGPIYNLTVNSDAMWGSITLRGGGTTSYIVPWVNAALEIVLIANKCESTANKQFNRDK